MTATQVNNDLYSRKVVICDDRCVLQFRLHRHEPIERTAGFDVAQILEQRTLVDQSNEGWPSRRLSPKCPKVAHTLGEVSKRAWSRRGRENNSKVAPRGVRPNCPSKGSVKTPKLAKVRSIRCKKECSCDPVLAARSPIITCPLVIKSGMPSDASEYKHWATIWPASSERIWSTGGGVLEFPWTAFPSSKGRYAKRELMNYEGNARTRPTWIVSADNLRI